MQLYNKMVIYSIHGQSMVLTGSKPLQFLILNKQTDELLLLLGIPGGFLLLLMQKKKKRERKKPCSLALAEWLTQESLLSLCISIFSLIWCESRITDSHSFWFLTQFLLTWCDSNVRQSFHIFFICLQAFNKSQEWDDCAQDAVWPITPVISPYGTVRICHKAGSSQTVAGGSQSMVIWNDNKGKSLRWIHICIQMSHTADARTLNMQHYGWCRKLAPVHAHTCALISESVASRNCLSAQWEVLALWLSWTNPCHTWAGPTSSSARILQGFTCIRYVIILQTCVCCICKYIFA